MTEKIKWALFIGLWVAIACWIMSCSERDRKLKQKNWTQKERDEYYERMEYRSMRGE